jgi:diguanylate cyclase (GGDEF)-like protein/PAS domain S-box-containing protein
LFPTTVQKMTGVMPSEERFTTIFALCPVGLALTAEDGLVIEANPALAGMLGMEPAQIVGRRLLDFTHPDDRPVSSRVGQSVIDGASAEVTLDKRYVTREGTVVPVRLTMIALEEPDGEAHKLVQVQNLSQQRETENDLRRAALEDQLTGLANRRALHREIAPRLTDVQGSSHPAAESPAVPPREAEPEPEASAWAVIYVDLDNFKSINDEHGHAVGDGVLVAVARRLDQVTRDADLVARIGGDEFVIVLGITSASEVTAAQTRIRRSLARPLRIEGLHLRVTASVGSALPRREDSTDGLIQRADAAMYADKHRDLERRSVKPNPSRPPE